MIWFSNQRHQQKNNKVLREELVEREANKRLELYKNSVEVKKASAQLRCVPCQLTINKVSQAFTDLLTKYAQLSAKVAQFVSVWNNDYLLLASVEYTALTTV